MLFTEVEVECCASPSATYRLCINLGGSPVGILTKRRSGSAVRQCSGWFAVGQKGGAVVESRRRAKVGRHRECRCGVLLNLIGAATAAFLIQHVSCALSRRLIKTEAVCLLPPSPGSPLVGFLGFWYMTTFMVLGLYDR